jgi:Cd2+/Zn2+-exporting ATPase
MAADNNTLNVEENRTLEVALTATTFLCLVASIGLEKFGLPAWSMPFNLIAYAAGGYTTIRASASKILHFELDVNLLMVIAAIGAAIIGSWHEA